VNIDTKWLVNIEDESQKGVEEYGSQDEHYGRDDGDILRIAVPEASSHPGIGKRRHSSPKKQ